MTRPTTSNSAQSASGCRDLDGPTATPVDAHGLRGAGLRDRHRGCALVARVGAVVISRYRYALAIGAIIGVIIALRFKGYL